MLNFLILIALVFIINKFLTNKSSSITQPSSKQNSQNKQPQSSNKIHSIYSKSTDSMIAHITSADEFAKVTSASNLVVVDFFATWCGPCKMIAPMLEKFATQYSTTDFYKLDIDELPEVASAQSVTSMPTLLFFKGGELVGKVIGANVGAIKEALTKLSA